MTISKENNILYLPPYDAEVEWLMSDGTQYAEVSTIQTYNAAKDSFQIEFWHDSSRQFGEVCGGRQSIGGVIHQLNLSTWGNACSFYWTDNSTKALKWTDTVGKNCRYVISVQPGLMQYSTPASSGKFEFDPDDYDIPCTGGYMLWGYKAGSTPYPKCACKICSFKFWHGSTLAADLVPVKKKVDGAEYGFFFDRVSKQLFGNKGSGQFSVGPDKQSKET